MTPISNLPVCVNPKTKRPFLRGRKQGLLSGVAAGGKGKGCTEERWWEKRYLGATLQPLVIVLLYSSCPGSEPEELFLGNKRFWIISLQGFHGNQVLGAWVDFQARTSDENPACAFALALCGLACVGRDACGGESIPLPGRAVGLTFAKINNLNVGSYKGIMQEWVIIRCFAKRPCRPVWANTAGVIFMFSQSVL